MIEESQIDQLAADALAELERPKTVANNRITEENQKLIQREKDLAAVSKSLDHLHSMRERSNDKAKPLALVVLDNIRKKLTFWSYKREKDKYGKKYGEN